MYADSCKKEGKPFCSIPSQVRYYGFTSLIVNRFKDEWNDGMKLQESKMRRKLSFVQTLRANGLPPLFTE